MPLSQQEKYNALTALECRLLNLSGNRESSRKTIAELGIDISPSLQKEMENSGLGNVCNQRLDLVLSRVVRLRKKMQRILGKK